MNFFNPDVASDEDEGKSGEVNQNGEALNANDVKLREKSEHELFNIRSSTDRLSMSPVYLHDGGDAYTEVYGTKSFGVNF